MQAQKGFTLIELMLTVFVAAILLSVAVPSFITMVENNSLASQINQFSAALNLARSEAVKRGRRIVLCRSSIVNNTCATAGGYEQGWIVFVDNDADGQRDLAPVEELLRVSEGLKQGYSLRGNNNFVSRITFEPSGNASQAGRFVLCKDNRVQNSRVIIVNFAGYFRPAPDQNGNSIPEFEGADISGCETA